MIVLVSTGHTHSHRLLLYLTGVLSMTCCEWHSQMQAAQMLLFYARMHSPCASTPPLKYTLACALTLAHLHSPCRSSWLSTSPSTARLKCCFPMHACTLSVNLAEHLAFNRTAPNTPMSTISNGYNGDATNSDSRDLSSGTAYFASSSTSNSSMGSGSALDERSLLVVVRDVASALEHLSVHGVQHCDVKPENVMLQLGGGAPQVGAGGVGNKGGLRDMEG
eukprot:scaffold57530_cov24-Tisochrysis_lutea.AAC.1